MQNAFGADFNIVVDEMDDNEGYIDDDPEKLNAKEHQEKGKRLIHGLNSLLQDTLYLHVVRETLLPGALPSAVAADLIFRMLEEYHNRIVKLLDEFLTVYKLRNIRALQLVAWVNEYQMKTEFYAHHFPERAKGGIGHWEDRESLIDHKEASGWWEAEAAETNAEKMMALRLRVIADSKRLNKELMQRYIVFRGMQQNSMIDRIIKQEEQWTVSPETLDQWKEEGGAHSSQLHTYSAQSLFTVIDSSVETVGSKYHISGKQLRQEVVIQLKALQNYTVQLSILYDRIFLPPLPPRQHLTDKYLESVFNISRADIGNIARTKIGIYSAHGSESKGVIEREYYWLISQINNFELFKEYALKMLKKIEERYVLDVDDKDISNKMFDETVALFKTQYERCGGVLASLIIQNCDDFYNCLFSEDWCKEKCTLVTNIFTRVQTGLGMFTNADVMSSDDMAFYVQRECLHKLGIEYVRELSRKKIDDLPQEDIRRAIQRDFRTMTQLIEEDTEDKKNVKHIMPNLLILTIDTCLSVPDDFVEQALADFKTILEAQIAFSKAEIQSILTNIVMCRDDLSRRQRNYLLDACQKGFKAEFSIPLPSIAVESKIKREWVLSISVLEGEHLVAKDKNGLSDPYVKVQIEDTASKVLYKAETSKITKTLNPRWNYFMPKISKAARQSFYQVVFTVWDNDVFGPDDFMGQAVLTRSQILEGIRNAALTRGSDDGSSFFDLVLQPINSKDEVSGSINVRITHKEVDGDSDVHLKEIAKNHAENTTKNLNIDEKDMEIQDVWHGGELRKFIPGNLFRWWQKRSFEVHKDGTLHYGKASVTSVEWKSYKIIAIYSDKLEDSNFQFEIKLENHTHSPIKLRAPNAAILKKWISYVNKLIAEMAIKSDSRHQSLDAFMGSGRGRNTSQEEQSLDDFLNPGS
uniref:Exocyst complex component Sec6 n=1 Tax=Amorphochlora amoebiformis TaxID=1561963 RepID=A0A7S0DFB6_9EUKA